MKRRTFAFLSATALVAAAGAVIAMIPCVVLYIALQRHYIRGLTSGMVKG